MRRLFLAPDPTPGGGNTPSADPPKPPADPPATPKPPPVLGPTIAELQAQLEKAKADGATKAELEELRKELKALKEGGAKPEKKDPPAPPRRPALPWW